MFRLFSFKQLDIIHFKKRQNILWSMTYYFSFMKNIQTNSKCSYLNTFKIDITSPLGGLDCIC